MSLIDITVLEMQNYLRINIDEDIELLEDLIESAIKDVISYVNREYEEAPTKLKTTAMKLVAIEYENRATDNSDLINKELNKLSMYRRNPGL